MTGLSRQLLVDALRGRVRDEARFPGEATWARVGHARRAAVGVVGGEFEVRLKPDTTAGHYDKDSSDSNLAISS
jgi:hypothetical protein